LTRKGSMAYALDAAHPQRLLCAIDTSAKPDDATPKGKDPGVGCVDALSAAAPAPLKGGPKAPYRGFVVAYDAHGNLTQKGKQFFAYSARDELTRMTDKDGKVLEANVYDATGERIVQHTQKDDDTTVLIDGIY